MRKYGWKGLILVVLAALVFVWLIKAPIVSAYLTSKMKVPVSVGRISLWPSHTTMHNFKILNPHGFKTPMALKADLTQIDYRFKQLIGNPVEIDQIAADGVFIGIEALNSTGTQNNWTAIGSRMPKIEKGKEVIIHKLILTNISVEIRGINIPGVSKSQQIARMEFDEIDSRKGFPTKQLIQQIFKGAGIDQYLQDIFDPVKVVEEVLIPFIGNKSHKSAEDFPEDLSLEREGNLTQVASIEGDGPQAKAARNFEVYF